MKYNENFVKAVAITVIIVQIIILIPILKNHFENYINDRFV